MGTHGSAVMEANTPQGPGDPITAGALLSPQELPLSSLGLQSQPRISRSPERAGYGCKTTTKSDASPGVSTEASRAGPAHQEGRFLAQPLREGKSVPKSDIPRDTPGASRFYWGKDPNTLAARRVWTRGSGGPHRRAGATPLGLSVTSWPWEVSA